MVVRVRVHSLRFCLMSIIVFPSVTFLRSQTEEQHSACLFAVQTEVSNQE